MITKKVRRSIFKNIFLDIETEETWLNKMSKQGFTHSEI